jgi:RNA polymerase sigma factor (TIGR02999 family)
MAKAITIASHWEHIIEGGFTMEHTQRAAEELLPLVYEELRRLARARLAGLAPGQTLQPTALVHEAFVRVQGKDVPWDGTRHFFFAAARAMHDVIVEEARKRASLKRGGGRLRLDLERLTIARDSPPEETAALADALEELAKTDARKHQLVMLRFFGGCTAQEAAAAMELSLSTVAREWRFARAWLHQRLSGPDTAGDEADHGEQF